MVNYCQDVKNFHDKFGMETPESFTKFAQDLFEFRVKFFHEEREEYEDAVSRGDLATAIDSLIDLVYICCGCALLHGISPEEFNELTLSLDIDHEDLFETRSEPELLQTPHLLKAFNHQVLEQTFRKNIDDYILAYVSNHEKGVKQALVALYRNCLFASYRMSFTLEQWDELWGEVQRANMAKKRAERPEESKRGSTKYDIVKPDGWVGPRTEELVQQYLGDARVTI